MLRSRNGRRVAVVLYGWIGWMLVAPGFAGAEPEDERRDFRQRAERPGRGERREGAPGHFIERHGDELGLSDDVRERIQAISDQSRLRAEQLHADTRVEHVKMRALLSQPSPDDAEVLAQSARVEALKAEQRSNRLEAMLQIRKLLTPEQRDQLAGMRGEGRPGGRRGFGDDRGFAERKGRGPEGRADKRRGGGRRSCRDDLAKLCPAAESGRERLRCLDAEWEGLSEACRASFEARGRRDARSEAVDQRVPSEERADERSPL